MTKHHHETTDQKEESVKENGLAQWHDWISYVYADVSDLQFMNYGYADLDEYINDESGRFSEKLYEQVIAGVPLTDQNVVEVSCGRGAGAVWCVRNYTPRSYVGTDLSPGVIEICRRNHSAVPKLSFVEADATKHLPFMNESLDIVLCIEATHAYGGPAAVGQFAREVARVLRPNGYLLWCDLSHVDGSDTSIDYLTSNSELVVQETVNITKNVLHALDIQSKSRAKSIERFVRPNDREFFRLFAGLPGTQIYEEMSKGSVNYWRAVFRKKTTATAIPNGH